MNRFLSFADSRMSAALERLGRQAEALDFFDEITLFTEHDLSAEFTSRMGRYLTPSCRGFGYWSWKPWSIHHVLQEMEEGDRLLYLDAGCHINANGTDRFREYVNMLDRDSCGMLVFTNGQPEYKWTKGDIFRHFGVSQEDGHITHTQQIAGGHVFLKKNPLTESLTGGVPEAVLDGRTGLVAPQGDLNQMAAHCERLIQDGKLLQTLAEEGRRHAEQTFSYPVIAARHAALYEETLREYRYEE